MARVEAGVAGGGVSFELTPEQRELCALAREFTEKEIRPTAAEYDEHSTHPADVIAKAHAIGLINLHLPEALGGLDLPAFDGMLVGEELSWGCSGIGTSIGANGLGAAPMLIAGTEEQKRAVAEPARGRAQLKTLDFTRPGTAAGAVGVAQAAFEYAVEYAKRRVAFDVPIAMHQGVNFMIADMAAEIEGARLLVWQSAWLHDQGQRATLQSSCRGTTELAAR